MPPPQPQQPQFQRPPPRPQFQQTLAYQQQRPQHQNYQHPPQQYNPPTHAHGSQMPTARQLPLASSHLPAAHASEWSTAQDPASGRIYYFNTRTGATSWQLPTVMHGPPQPVPNKFANDGSFLKMFQQSKKKAEEDAAEAEAASAATAAADVANTSVGIGMAASDDTSAAYLRDVGAVNDGAAADALLEAIIKKPRDGTAKADTGGGPDSVEDGGDGDGKRVVPTDGAEDNSSSSVSNGGKSTGTAEKIKRNKRTRGVAVGQCTSSRRSKRKTRADDNSK